MDYNKGRKDNLKGSVHWKSIIFEMKKSSIGSSLDTLASQKLDALKFRSQKRKILVTQRGQNSVVFRDTKKLISFCCNDYLGLSQNKAVKKEAMDVIEEFGVGAGASRLVTGNHPLYQRLETKLSHLKNTKATLVFGSGYLANIGITPALVGPKDLVVADELIHSSLHGGIRASKANVSYFKHNDIEDCHKILREERARYQHCLLMTEGVFSMDGDRAPLSQLCDLSDEFDVWLMTDDAHGFGVLGGGKGTAVEEGVEGRIPLQMGTLSKAVGSYGGFLCASRPVVDLLVNRARSLIYATGLPPSAVAAACAALDIIAQGGKLVAAPMEKARRFCQQLGLCEPKSPIVPLILGESHKALEASEKLAGEGFLVTGIRPPTVPEGTARLRLTFSATHANSDIDRLTVAVHNLGLVK